MTGSVRVHDRATIPEGRNAMSDEEQQDDSGDGGSDDEKSRAQQVQENWDKAEDKMREIEEGDPPIDLSEWPKDEAKYVTYGGGEGDHGYDEGPETKLGPSSLERHEDGSVTIDGEEVDDPDEYKSDDPITEIKE
jgi:hypothetical protein